MIMTPINKSSVHPFFGWLPFLPMATGWALSSCKCYSPFLFGPSSVPNWNLTSSFTLSSTLFLTSHPIGGQALPILPLEPNPFSPSTHHFQLSSFSFSPRSMPQIFLNTHIRHLLLEVFLAYLHPSVWAQYPKCSHCILCISITTLILCALIVCLPLYVAPNAHKLLESGVCVLL